jgi:hypothetical protein
MISLLVLAVANAYNYEKVSYLFPFFSSRPTGELTLNAAPAC